jgi:hypothetical protein
MKELAKLKENNKMETVILEKLIIKIGALLAVGFGEAGSEIIASNMKRGGHVDPMIPGKKILVFPFSYHFRLFLGSATSETSQMPQKSFKLASCCSSTKSLKLRMELLTSFAVRPTKI